MAQEAGGQVRTVMQETRVFPPPKEFAATASIGSIGRLRSAVERGCGRRRKILGRTRRRAALVSALRQSTGVERAGRQMVRRRSDQRFVQLPRRAPAHRAEEQGGARVGRRAGRHPYAHLSATAPRSVQVRQRVEEAGREAGRRRVGLYADGARAGDCHAGLRGSAQYTPLSLPAFPPKRLPIATTMPAPSCSSPRTTAGGGARSCR